MSKHIIIVIVVVVIVIVISGGGIMPSEQEGHGTAGRGPEEATETIRGLKNLPYKDRMSDSGLFNLEEKRLWGHLRATFHYLNLQKSWGGTFSRACDDRMRAEGD